MPIHVQLYLQFLDDGVFLQNLITQVHTLGVITIFLAIYLRLHGGNECIPLLNHVMECRAF